MIGNLFNLEWYQLGAIFVGLILAIRVLNILYCEAELNESLAWFIAILCIVYAVVFWVRILVFDFSGTANWVNAMIGCVVALIFVKAATWDK